MLNFFESIIDYVGMFFNMLINVLKTIVMAIPLVRVAGDLPLFMAEYIPPVFASMAALLAGVYFVKFYLGR